MDGWAETYYRNDEDYAAQRNKVLPYSVNCKTPENIGKLTTRLREAGYTYAVTQTGMPNRMTSFLINTVFKKYAKIPFPVHFATVNDRVYTIEEFFDEILNKQ